MSNDNQNNIDNNNISVVGVDINNEDIINIERSFSEETRHKQFETRLIYVSRTLPNVYKNLIIDIERAFIVFMINEKYKNLYIKRDLMEAQRIFYSSLTAIERLYPVLKVELYKMKLFVEDFYIKPFRYIKP